MNILSIGNSFSQDAHRFLSPLAAASGDEIWAVNLYIGGCSLETHWANFLSGEAAYEREENGIFVAFSSIQEALASARWDVITLQQASHFSGEAESYFPYLPALYEELRKRSPESRFYIHQTWAYEQDADHPDFVRYGHSQKEMYRRLRAAYSAAAESIGCPLIPVGDAIQRLREQEPAFDYGAGGLSLNCDGYHLSPLYGRYTAALVWYETLMGRQLAEPSFIPEEDGQRADEALIRRIHNCLHG